ncbi:MAG: terminase family protein [Proteobacteria bacterium]|nr:terminase family protein [Pseudomonadota bacterium]
MNDGGGGAGRLARRMLEQAKALTVPALPDPDVAPMSRLAFARAAGFAPDAWQENALESRSRKLLFNCCRQSGKSTTSALLAVHEAAFVPGGLVLMLAPSLRQSGELFRKCLQIMKGAECPLPAIVSESALRVELDNGSRIIALPGSEATTRGYSAATLVIIDEASRVPDELIAAVRPSLATTNGRLIALSTPNGKRGWFYLEYVSGIDWERTTITSADCARISPEFLKDEERTLGPHVFGQEYLCEFYDPDTAVFSIALIERALSGAVTPLWGHAA